MLEVGAIWAFTSTTMASLMFFWSMYKQFVPYQVRNYLEKTLKKYLDKFFGTSSNFVCIKFPEYTGEGLSKSRAYDDIRNYLSSRSTARAKRLKAKESKNSKSLVLCLDDNEAVVDVFQGVKVVWSLFVEDKENQSVSKMGRYLTLSFDNHHREMITETYIDHVLREGKEIALKNRERKLYTNNSRHDYISMRDGRWSSVPFTHPATFETLAMDLDKKEEIKKDLIKFTKGKDYYRKVAKPWKRGYLLFGPPGTGKSTMISAMANFLEYDVYDLELTTVKDNAELKKLILDTKGKSIVVIEDIDCSLELTEHRKKKKEEDEDDDDEEEKKEAENLKRQRAHDEKIIVFTTNFVDNLDPALIRRGRMDYHIEMSYCRFEAFKVLAKNYLENESHDLYGDIGRLLEEVDVSPADVAENLMPKSDEDDVDICLRRLVKSLEEEKKKKVEKEARRKEKKAEKKEKKVNGAEENGTKI
ncbi:P-loop containing nucleoside triphosphate hydrolase [Arabidopsis thaliana x Arabidopsis arenosa]|uniref:P-loop containing nucleoside triphosphate hydrolase n=1 Tax=Arabidopsis thaliana x Arabidopsis arenosa TaxID=1240361 RepID=A0A8T1ZI26_9BRAS|nr:P-loop containing nucleoside triphosphate hydrolase [Arabidopsis thaliana x Arabidopsis arenosa]